MSPLREDLEGAASPEWLPLLLLRQIQSEGYRSFLAHWGERLTRFTALDAFGEKRMNELLAAAVEFDLSGRGPGGGFLSFMEHYQVREIAAEEGVRVMTVHQAKGLGFDVVILPELQEKSSMGRARNLRILTSRRKGRGGSRWVLQMPRKKVALSDGVLAGAVAVKDAEAALEELCVLYVAMTRAREGLFMVTSPQGRKSVAFTPATLLKERTAGHRGATSGRSVLLGGEKLTCLFESGHPDWYRKRRITGEGAEGKETPALPDRLPRPAGRRRLVQVRPSAREEAVFSAHWLFGIESRQTLEFGNAVHRLFEKVGWIEDLDREGAIGEWEREHHFPPALRRPVLEQFRNSLESEEVRRALGRREGEVDLWRERPFDVVLGQRWLSGVFDRVALRKEGSGKTAGGRIIDFKSDRVHGDFEIEKALHRYRPQMELYGLALARLLNVALREIELQLIFTGPGVVRSLGSPREPDAESGTKEEG
jgi:ATP-dependent helicase/nuclease subunit A